jgi:Domain of unknown function (DUF4214)
MSDRSGMQTCEASFFAEDDDAEFSRPSPTAAGYSHAIGRAPFTLKRASLDHSSLARRIHDNLNWAYAFDRQASPVPPVDLWQEIKTLWVKPNEGFVTGLYEVLLGRPPEPEGLATLCAALADGASRVALARTIALSAEAAVSELDISWLPRLNDVESESVWEKVQSLWDEPDSVFVANLYPLLLVRPPEPAGVVAHCRAMKTGASRACVVRAFALSDEALLRGLSFSWLPRLEIITRPSPPPPPFLALHWLKTAFRRWRHGKKRALLGISRKSERTPQPARNVAEGGPA